MPPSGHFACLMNAWNNTLVTSPCPCEWDWEWSPIFLTHL
jgi:hypothetical protein